MTPVLELSLLVGTLVQVSLDTTAALATTLVAASLALVLELALLVAATTTRSVTFAGLHACTYSRIWPDCTCSLLSCRVNSIRYFEDWTRFP